MKNNMFKGLWISKEILGAKDLNSNDKLTLATISALDGDNGCYCSFDYIVECTGISRSTVIRSVNKLVDKGYVDREYINKTSTILRISAKMTLDNNTNQNETSVKMELPSVKMELPSVKVTPVTSVKMKPTSVKMTPNNIDNTNKYNTNNTNNRELPKDSNGNKPLQNQIHIDDVVVDDREVIKDLCNGDMALEQYVLSAYEKTNTITHIKKWTTGVINNYLKSSTSNKELEWDSTSKRESKGNFYNSIENVLLGWERNTYYC